MGFGKNGLSNQLESFLGYPSRSPLLSLLLSLPLCCSMALWAMSTRSSSNTNHRGHADKPFFSSFSRFPCLSVGWFVCSRSTRLSVCQNGTTFPSRSKIQNRAKSSTLTRHEKARVFSRIDIRTKRFRTLSFIPNLDHRRPFFHLSTMVRSLVLASLVATASAFAPAQVVSTIRYSVVQAFVFACVNAHTHLHTHEW